MIVRSIMRTPTLALSLQTAMPDQVWMDEAEPQFSFLRSPMILKLRHTHPRFAELYALLTRSIMQDEVHYIINLQTLEIVDAQPATGEPTMTGAEELAQSLLTASGQRTIEIAPTLYKRRTAR